MNLKGLIYGRGFTQWGIARKLNWTESRVSRIVTGRVCPSEEDLEAISSVLELGVKDLEDVIQVTDKY